MMSELNIGVSENLTRLQVSAWRDESCGQSSMGELFLRAHATAVDAAFLIPSADPLLLYRPAAAALNLAEINGIIIGHRCENGLQNVRAQQMPSDTDIKKDQADLAAIMAKSCPWVPAIAGRQLSDPVLLENFVVCVTALNELNRLQEKTLTRHLLIDFHSRYKLVLLAHNQPGYRKIGPFVADLHQWDNLHDFFLAYRKEVMAILQQPASRENHVNAMMHIQGYFNRNQTAKQRSELSNMIHSYRLGHISLKAPLGLLKDYLSEYPNEYLLTQQYFTLYSNDISGI